MDTTKVMENGLWVKFSGIGKPPYHSLWYQKIMGGTTTVVQQRHDGMWTVLRYGADFHVDAKVQELPGVKTADEAKAVAETMYRMGEL